MVADGGCSYAIFFVSKIHAVGHGTAHKSPATAGNYGSMRARVHDDPKQLYDEVVELTGLSTIIAQGTIGRALEKVNATIETATVVDYLEAMPELRKRIAGFLPTVETRRKLRDFERQLKMRAGHSGPIDIGLPKGN